MQKLPKMKLLKLESKFWLKKMKFAMSDYSIELEIISKFTTTVKLLTIGCFDGLVD